MPPALMTNRYTLYLLTLISSFTIYWLFGTMMTVAAGVDSVPRLSFLTRVLQFGIGSWLLYYGPGIGRWVALVLGILMLTWPVYAKPWIVKEGEIWGMPFMDCQLFL